MTPIERLARVIDSRLWEAIDDGRLGIVEMVTAKAMSLTRATEAIRCLREPTEEMIQACYVRSDDNSEYEQEIRRQIVSEWQKMIDAATDLGDLPEELP